ncbi:multidrug efflux RND transporter permease subunit [Barnesiella sp. WM24]|uniref:efflux RND transporter permease subunit n=1 Tax=Barnesiella sp. WM24 TaxID=2558278 RepID=UPI000AC52B47|nr:multidrug efflux RND transporter permease subunit [Barnesiella sp. WM24]MDE6114104.1 multidrug efflux RND transporter permease subunit [Muribaculum sp.]TFU92512.1 multidrug efflux RND transporter permease subunit [Barnesiella sp. WM24]
MFSKFFIDRPIFATVLAIVMVFAGLLTIKSLPVAQYPDITPPTVSVMASYPGANAETVARTVGVPIEEQVNGVENMLYMSSNSGSDGSYMLTITFELGTDVDQAAINVQNRLNQAEATLPTAVKEQGISVNKESTNIVLFCSVEGDSTGRYDALYLTNYANINLVNALSRVKGVGGVEAFGGGEYSMRIWLDPELMRVRGLTPDDVYSAIRSQNMEVSAGEVGAAPNESKDAFQFTLTSRGGLQTADEFANIVIRTDGDGILRLRDVAKVDLGSQSYTATTLVSGKPAALLGIKQLPGANALSVSKAARAELDRLSQYFPPGVKYNVVLDTSDFVTASIEEVLVTFVETALIVMVVILIFLQNWRAVIIPMLTIPVSLIATFAVMKLMGFTINTLTLFGLVLAIAIVVDDAIVVVEDCARLVDEGKLSRRQAAEKAMQELTGPVIGEVLVLLSVFIPTAFVSGITGQLYKQFALTIAVSTAFSGFNALTFTPAMCALFLTPRNKNTKNPVYRIFNKGYNAVENLYKKSIGKMLRHAGWSLCLYVLIAVAGVVAFLMWPTSYVPQEDQGYFMSSIQLPEGASLERTQKVVDDLSAQIRKELPEVADVMAISGFSFMGGGASSNMGSLFVVLKPWKERKSAGQSVFAMIDSVGKIASRYQEAIVFSVNPSTIPGLGMSSGLEMQLLDINNLGASEMMKAIASIQEAVKGDDRIASVTSLYQGVVPQYRLDIDRDKVKLQGLMMEDIFSTLGAYMGGSYVNDFTEFGRVYQVTVKGNDNARGNIDDVLRLSVRNADGEMVPFASFTTIVPVMGEPSASRYNMYGTASITANLAKGVSSSDGIKAMEEIVDKTLGANYSYAWTGEAYQETQAGTTVTLVFAFAIILTLLVLAAQYESWTDPVAVVLSMPVAILGTVIGSIIMGQSISIYTQIGLILLLGLSAKNAILIVEYATYFRRTGVDLRQAAEDAGVIRFRPIMMTAIAFIFGVMPMMFAHGAGAESRVALGSAVVFGMLMNALLGTLFVPNFWEIMQRFQEKVLDKLFKDVDTVPPGDNDKMTSV